MEATLIFPHQLYTKHPALAGERRVYLIEDSLFFYDEKYRFKFHKQKLVLHRASLKYFEKELIKKGLKTEYLQWTSFKSMTEVLQKLNADQVKKIHLCEPDDFLIKKRLQKETKKHSIQINYYLNPGFLTSPQIYQLFFQGKKSYFFTDFYIEQRKRLNILVDKNQKPIGGKWSFDSENRKKLPKKIDIPQIYQIESDEIFEEAKVYVEKNFPDHYGTLEDFNYPYTRNAALESFELFLNERLDNFGAYEDAISKDHSYIFHSILTPALNIGLITPEEIVQKTLAFSKNKSIPLNSLEGFLRQIIGWREYIRAMYDIEGLKQRNQNFWKFNRKIPPSFWKGETGIEPIDHVIKKILKTGYAHHIERLMILGNFFLLCEFDPKEVYKWFMELFTDSYDWVMVPNVYAMSQFADGGKMMTKPYISGANYIKKMSDFPTGEWEKIWTALYWRFIQKHEAFFKKNYRLSMMVNLWNKKTESQKKEILKIAEKFLANL